MGLCLYMTITRQFSKSQGKSQGPPANGVRVSLGSYKNGLLPNGPRWANSEL